MIKSRKVNIVDKNYTILYNIFMENIKGCVSMIKNLKKILSVMLSIILLFCCMMPAFATEHKYQNSVRTTVPTVYVHGYGNWLYADANDKNSEPIFNDNIISQETIDSVIAGIKEPLLYGIKTDDWKPYSNFLVNSFKKDLSIMALDENGNASNGSGNTFNHDMKAPNRIGKDGKYNMVTSYEMDYDWRLDPVELAEQLNKYIDRVLEVTGYDKVNLVGRCLGSNIVMCYLYKYGFEKINSLQFYIGLFNGIDLVGALYSGRVVIDPDSLYRFIEQNIVDDGGDLSILKAILAVLNATKGLNLPIELVNKVYEEVYETVIPEMLLYSYGTMPACWSYVGPNYYDDAKELVFKGQEEKYAELIRKLDHYHYDIVPEFANIIKKGLEQGVNIYNFAKYGGNMLPVCEESVYQNDNVTTIVSQTFGSVGSKIHRHFGYKYLDQAEKNDTLKYISPDRNVDASNDILRDHTWFIRGSGHANMPVSINILMANVFEANGYGDYSQYITTNYFDDYPQFLIADRDTNDTPIEALTEDNLDKIDPWHQSVYDRFLFLLQEIFDFITDVVKNIHMTIEAQKANENHIIIAG